MRKLITTLALAGLVSAPAALRAQRPDAPPPMAGPMAGRGGGPGAALFLARTGELQLTDQQVTRLAAIARRGEARRQAMWARVDSARAAMRPDSAGPRRPPAPLFTAAEMTRMREQEKADLRDALQVLTPDQQATAFMMVAGGRGGPRGEGRGHGGRGPGGPGGDRRGPGRAGGA